MLWEVVGLSLILPRSLGGTIVWIWNDPCSGASRQRSIRELDGYLGTIHSRREDRLLNALKTRVNQRSYQRGVHKGERIDPADYFWPPDFNPTNGLKAEAVGMRQAPVMTLAERLQVTEQQMIPRGAVSLIELNPERMAQLKRLAPNWR